MAKNGDERGAVLTGSGRRTASSSIGSWARSRRSRVLASSSQGTYLDHYLDLLDAYHLVDAATTAADVETSEPAPDLIQVAKEKARTRAVAMVGDSPWDVEAGAEIVFASLPELRDRLQETSLDRGT